MAFTVRDIDRGWNAIRETMAGPPGVVKVGIVGPKATALEKDSPLTVAEVAAVHEFGLNAPRIPRRSFIGSYVDQKFFQIRQTIGTLGGKVAMGEMEMAAGLETLGLFVQAGIQEHISQGISPANAPETIERKGSSKPLVNHGQLRSSITFEVVES